MLASTSQASRSLFSTRVAARRCIHATVRVLEAGPSSGTSELETALRAGLKEAMKTRNRAASTTLKTILADITYLAKSSPNPSQPLAQENVLSAIRKGISQRTQAAESYAPGTPSAHEENFANLQQEVELLQSYLPPSPTAETVRGYIDEIIAGLSEEVRRGKGATGNVMKALWDKLGEAKGLVDKKEVGKWVNEALKR